MHIVLLAQVGGPNTPPCSTVWQGEWEGEDGLAWRLVVHNKVGSPAPEIIVVQTADESDENFMSRVDSVVNWMCM
jgi:hypothetical protein